MALQVKERTLFQRLDFNLILVVLAIQLIGLINIYSTTHGPTVRGVSSYFWAQVIFVIAGWIIFAGCTLIDYRVYSKLAYPLYVLNVIFLILTMFIGKTSLGAQRWINLGPFHYQPSETMKLVMVFVLARYFHTHVRPQGHSLRELLLPFLLLLVPAGIVMRQPDLGTGLLLVAVGGTMFLFVKIKPRVLIGLSVILLLAVPLAWKFTLKEYQKNRVLTFLDPSRDPRGAGYNSIQSKIAVGSGQVFGKGFRKGTQSQLKFLPESHTDFIFSVLSEEHGFVGSITALALFLILFFMGLRIATQANDKFGALLVIGSMGIIFWHMFINVGMTTGILPIVGIPLPLVSYGGSSFLTTMTALGIVSSVSLRRFLF